MGMRNGVGVRSFTRGNEILTRGNQPEPFAGLGGEASSTGCIVLAAASLRVLHVNEEALRILTYPEDPAKVPSVDDLVARRILPLLAECCRTDPGLPTDAALRSGSRRYRCRAFSLSAHAGHAGSSRDSQAIVVLLERFEGENTELCRLARELRLTPRERETVELLRQGLETKQIAERMNVSPYTVKAFLKAIMIKTGASTRSGIIGRMFCRAPSF